MTVTPPDAAAEDRSRVPAACTLPTVDRPLRLAEFDAMFSGAVRAVRRLEPTRVRLELEPVPSVAARAADLAARESACCAFFTFTLTVGDGALSLDVAAPARHAEVLRALADRAEALSGGSG
jgi:hypothetical protein